MNEKMQKALNEQLNLELSSSYLYLSMAAYLESVNLPGFAHWLTVQEKEEKIHAMKFYRYVFDRDGRVHLSNIATPTFEWKSPSHVFEEGLKHEKMITAQINKLAGLALAENDFNTHNFLQWFLNEQVEEEANFRRILEQVRMIEKSPESLYVMDKDMAARVMDPALAALA
jgi:ferritin